MSESILYICAHPDDCELMFGGMIHSFVKKGMDVSVIVVADGSKWIKDETLLGEDIRKIRKNEALTALRMLGVKDIKFLEYSDGVVDGKKLRDPLLDIIREINPNIIFTHSEEEKHPDHIEVSRCVKRVCNRLSEPAPIINPFWKSNFCPVSDFQQLYTYAALSEVNEESVCFIPLEEEDIEKKICAVLCHKSQFMTEDKERVYDRIMTEAKFFGNLCGRGYAEICASVRSQYYKVLSIV